MAAENQRSVAEWSNETFGADISPCRIWLKVYEETNELGSALDNGFFDEAAEEIADVAIVLFRLAEQIGVDLLDQVNEKMKKNRSRKWNKETWKHVS